MIDLESPYFTSQLITYIGNKRSLLPFINKGVEEVKRRLSKEKLTILDGFSGSGAVSRLLKHHAASLWVNDLEDYCDVVNRCYLANGSDVDIDSLTRGIAWLNEHALDGARRGKPGFIETNYAPKDDEHIRPGERVFYTNTNAKIIDTLKHLINTKIDKNERHFFLAPLVVEASVHTNTSGVFKGFHKKDGIGCFGGRGGNALARIKSKIVLEVPVLSGVECEVQVKKGDINGLLRSGELPERLDLAYYDPPYNQHPYGSNYFMLNIIAKEAEDAEIQSGVSGIARDWNRSRYNKKKEAEDALDDLIAATSARYILLSYNNEGIIPIGCLKKIVRRHGTYDLMRQAYNTYRGSRNLNARNIRVEELLWIVKKR